MNKEKNCTCGELHISKRICHHYNEKPCHVINKSINCDETNTDVWEREFDETMSHKDWHSCVCCQRAIGFKKNIRSFISEAEREVLEKKFKQVQELETIEGTITDGFKKAVLHILSSQNTQK